MGSVVQLFVSLCMLLQDIISKYKQFTMEEWMHWLGTWASLLLVKVRHASLTFRGWAATLTAVSICSFTRASPDNLSWNSTGPYGHGVCLKEVLISLRSRRPGDSQQLLLGTLGRTGRTRRPRRFLDTSAILQLLILKCWR